MYIRLSCSNICCQYVGPYQTWFKLYVKQSINSIEKVIQYK